MSTKMDVSSVGYVVWCEFCLCWRDLYPTKREAILYRLRHEIDVHGLYDASASKAYKRLSASDKKYISNRLRMRMI